MDDAATSPPAPDLGSLSVLVLGAGNMGGAFVQAALAAGVPAEGIAVLNASEESTRRAADRLGARAGSRADVARADVLVIGVKPYQLEDVLPGIAEDLREDALVLSLAAGTSLAALTTLLGGHTELVRAMPSTPIAIGEGVTQLMPAAEASAAARRLAQALFGASGLVIELPEEKAHAVIGAAGSGVAFVLTIIDAMVDEAVRQGIPRPDATRIVAQTVRGAGSLILQTDQHPAVARSAVMSPGGTTAQGLAALDAHGLRPALAAAMTAAADTSRALSEG